MRLAKKQAHAGTHGLTRDQHDRFLDAGYLLLHGQFSADECAAFSLEADRLAHWAEIIRPDNLRTELWGDETCPRISKFDPVTDISPLFSALAADSRITRPLESLFGESANLFKDKLIYKQPGHQGFGVHQDIAWYWPFPESIITAMVCIDPANASNGALEVAEGYQHMPNPVTPGELRNLTAAEMPSGPSWRLLQMEPGDVVLFGVRLPHCSGPNSSDHSRRVLHLSYNPVSEGNLYAEHYEHRRRFLLRDNAVSQGNFYLPAKHRANAEFYPPLGTCRSGDSG